MRGAPRERSPTRAPHAAESAQTWFHWAHYLHKTIMTDHGATLALLHGSNPAAPWYRDLLELSRLESREVKLTIANVPEGVHDYTATATDAAKNTSAPSEARRVRVDLTAPAAPQVSGGLDGFTIGAEAGVGWSPRGNPMRWRGRVPIRRRRRPEASCRRWRESTGSGLGRSGR